MKIAEWHDRMARLVVDAREAFHSATGAEWTVAAAVHEHTVRMAASYRECTEAEVRAADPGLMSALLASSGRFLAPDRYGDAGPLGSWEYRMAHLLLTSRGHGEEMRVQHGCALRVIQAYTDLDTTAVKTARDASPLSAAGVGPGTVRERREAARPLLMLIEANRPKG